MPRTTQQIIEHAEELAARFENMEPTGEPAVTPLGELYLAVLDRANAERDIQARVAAARKAGASWSVIGSILGTSDEAARQRYDRRSGPRTETESVTSMRGRTGRAQVGAAKRGRRDTRVAARDERVAAKTSKRSQPKSVAKGTGAKAGSTSKRK